MTKKNEGLEGILLLDKPLYLSSNKALQIVKKLLGAKKAGHTGTLDPLATGMLPICFGQATKYAEYLLTADKTYQVKAQLGKRTATGDSEGEVIATRQVPLISLNDLEKLLDHFRGEIEQIPPMFSALKQAGQPLYKLAREGRTVNRPPRKVTIYRLEILDFSNDTISLELTCSKGCYVRTIIDDLGELIGCGAYITELRRTRISHFSPEKMIPLEFLQQQIKSFSLDTLNQYLIPSHLALTHLPLVTLSNDDVARIQQGKMVMIEDAVTKGVVVLLNGNQEFLGLGEIQQERQLKPKRLQTT
ncbi:MAG: tRNA pseudouridine(55) synthase TruB [Proteobacteria bacterium]|nr:tRNA pseudouridine(55) synthase TruB [Pseudomonadota bacterium]